MRRDGHKVMAGERAGGGSNALEAALRAEIAPFIVMDVMQAAAERERAGERVVHMEVGQPASSAPKAALRAVAERLNRDALGYTLALGMPELRERIAGLYKRWYGIEVPMSRIVVTNGSSGAFILSFLALFDVGRKVGLPNPGYPCYRHILSALGIGSHLIETGPETRWMPTPEAVARAARESGINGLLLASPSNPTGTMLSPERLGQIVETCDRQGLWFISDEIYHGLTYGMAEATALQFSDEAIVINSFSKYFSMTGWRVGWMVVPERLVRVIERLAQNLFISAPAVSQVAAIGAFDGFEELEANKCVYAANRELLMRGFAEAGLEKIVPADGAFYLYVDAGAHTNDSLAFTKSMLAETGVAATPGLDFDPERGHRFVRFSYAGSTTDMAEAVARLKAWPRLKRGT